MVTTDEALVLDKKKGLKYGAIGLVSSTVVGVASTAPAYSLASTLGYVVIAIAAVQAPIVTIIAFVPMLFIALGYKELNSADPDCGTTFTWGARAFGPKAGWAGGWGIVAADILVMASLAQVAGQYVFLLFNTGSIGTHAASGWVLLVGIAWIVLMTAICYVGIEISANFQKALLGIEITMLAVLSIWALIKVGNGTAPIGHLGIRWSWFDPFHMRPSALIVGTLFMTFIYWGWDTAVSVNEETKDPRVFPGLAAVLSTFVLLGTYLLVVLSVQSYAGVGSSGIGLGNSAHEGDVLSVLGNSVFGTSGFGSFLTHLLLLMVLSSAAASTQTTILPTARTTLSMGVYQAIPKVFSKTHKRFLTPTYGTVLMGIVSIGLYVILNYISPTNVIGDSISALGAWIAFYYGLTGFESFWYFRSTLLESARNFFMRGLLPLLGGLMLWGMLGYDLYYYWKPGNSNSTWHMGIWPHWTMGGTFLISVIPVLVGVVLMFTYRVIAPAYFRGEVLNASTPTLVPEDMGNEVGLFGIDSSQVRPAPEPPAAPES
jgi:amino acid transporter